jgi:hypothetical protein
MAFVVVLEVVVAVPLFGVLAEVAVAGVCVVTAVVVVGVAHWSASCCSRRHRSSSASTRAARMSSS